MDSATTELVSERSERDTLRSVQLKIGDIYIMVRATSVYSAGEPYAAALYCRGKNPATLGYVSVLEFVAIESYLMKAISSDYQTKNIELQKKRLESAEERARARASSACAQTR